jgi:hypothetical protein
MSDEQAASAVEPVDETTLDTAGYTIPEIIELIESGQATAEQALAGETGRGDDARKTLVEKLESMIEQAPEGSEVTEPGDAESTDPAPGDDDQADTQEPAQDPNDPNDPDADEPGGSDDLDEDGPALETLTGTVDPPEQNSSDRDPASIVETPVSRSTRVEHTVV